MNMLTNAVDAIEGEGQITIATRVESDGVAISFTDTGAGISEEAQSQIFDPFFTTKDIGQGTGLGLSISYGIVAKHGGKIKVESVPGKGTTFTIVLPTQMPEDGEMG